jgi:hypothetical protein
MELPSPDDLQQARAIIAREQAEREQRCLAEICAVLGTYGCELRALLTIENGHIEQRVRVVALPDGQASPPYSGHT